MTMEVIEGEVRESLPAIRHEEAQAGTFALAAMTDDEFTTRLAALKRGRDRIAAIQRELMDKDVDYGTIPGTPKPTLLKPGAEKLCDIYGLRADFAPERVIGDGISAPALAYQTRCELHLGSLDGPVVAVGYGSANSWERKHRYRRAERACPECGLIGSLLRSKHGKAEWFCWAKKGGCGKTFPIADPRVTEQPLGDVENPDPWDLDTTLLKMAEKRAHVDATLRATAASGLFTQDVEDQPRQEAPLPEPPQTIAQTVAQRRSRSAPPGDEPPPYGVTTSAPEMDDGRAGQGDSEAPAAAARTATPRSASGSASAGRTADETGTVAAPHAGPAADAGIALAAVDATSQGQHPDAEPASEGSTAPPEAAAVGTFTPAAPSDEEEEAKARPSRCQEFHALNGKCVREAGHEAKTHRNRDGETWA
jgi:hypothetical protein